MQTSLFRRFTTAAIVLVAGLGAAVSAHARSDVSFSIGIHVPGVYVQPAPIYYQPQPVYVQPRPVYVQPAPIYYQPRPVLVNPQAYGHYYGPGPGWKHDKWERKHWRKHQRRDGGRDGRGHRDRN